MEEQSSKQNAYLIGISGGSASGKTSVAELIFQKIGKDCILYSMDSYYRQIR
jgi:uridine kinase